MVHCASVTPAVGVTLHEGGSAGGAGSVPPGMLPMMPGRVAAVSWLMMVSWRWSVGVQEPLNQDAEESAFMGTM